MTACELVTEHSSVGPSGIASIILCPGMVRMQQGLEDKPSFAAAEGTVAHRIGELRLNGKKIPKTGTIIEQEGHKITVDTDMLDAVDMYVEHINSLRSLPFKAKEEKIEGKVSLDHIGIPEVYGTVDYALSIPFKTLFVRDYKHGTGITVEAENSEQLMPYAIGVAGEMLETFETINIGIVQPRTREGDQIKIWETTPDHLVKWANTVLKPTVKLALSDNAPLVPGEKQCQWCKAKGVCPALAKQALTIAQADFAEYADFTPDEIVETVSIEKITEVYKQLPLLKSFIKAVEARVFNELSIGNRVEGFKLVKGRRSRDWKDELEAVNTLEELGIDPYLTKVVSPAQAEKLTDKQGKEVIKKLVEYTDGTPSITTEDDKREAITSASEDFKTFKKE